METIVAILFQNKTSISLLNLIMHGNLKMRDMIMPLLNCYNFSISFNQYIYFSFFYGSKGTATSKSIKCKMTTVDRQTKAI